MMKWYDEPGDRDSNVIYSRIRLVRNLADYPFPELLDKEKYLELGERLSKVVCDAAEKEGITGQYRDETELTELQKRALFERNAINRNLLLREKFNGLYLSEDEKISIAIGVDDHLRIQGIERGLNLEKCYRRVDALDDRISEQVDYAFDDKYGYLTAFPTNVGTGLHATVIVHLPMLSKKKNFSSLVADLGRFGTIIRGVFGEGNENVGSLYQVSNQKTLGQTEKDIVSLVSKAAAELDAQERRLRKEEIIKRPVLSSDECFKSYGVLKYARRLSGKEAIMFLSQIMAGVTDGVLEIGEPCSIYSLIMRSQAANILSQLNRPYDKEELEVERAGYIRAHLPEIH